jgi:hypothetical protein
LTLSIYADDVLNNNRNAFNSFETPLLIRSKQNTGKFGFSLNNKILSKNKLAKENPNLLNKEKKQDFGILNQYGVTIINDYRFYLDFVKRKSSIMVTKFLK